MSEPNPYDGYTIYDEARYYKGQYEKMYGRVQELEGRLADSRALRAAIEDAANKKIAELESELDHRDSLSCES